MPSPVRFIGGVSSSRKGTLFGEYGVLAPDQWYSSMSDFIMGGADISGATPAEWTVTKVGTGAITQVQEAGGAVLFTNSAADNDSISAQQKNAHFAIVPTKRAFFQCRIKVSDATQSDLLFGLTALDTTPYGAAATEETGVADGLFFVKPDAVATVKLASRSGSATGVNTAALGTMVAATYMKLGWYFDGGTTVSSFIDGVKTGDHTLAVLPTGVLSVTAHVQNGEAVAKTATVDWLFAAVER